MRIFGLDTPELGIISLHAAPFVALYIAAVVASILLCRSAKRGGRENGYAIAALICGIVGILRPGSVFGLAFAIAAIVLSRKPAGNSQGMATAALVLGIIATVLGALSILGTGLLFFFVAAAC